MNRFELYKNGEHAKDENKDAAERKLSDILRSSLKAAIEKEIKNEKT